MKWLFDRKDVFSALNAEDAEKFVQEKFGYFADSLEELNTVINNRDNYLLKCVEDYTYDKRFMYEEEDGEVFHTCFFLPEDKILAVKSEYRPFKYISEWRVGTDTDLGDKIYIREKGNEDIWEGVIISGFSCNSHGELVKVILGGRLYTPKLLLDECEFQNADTAEWCRFGVEE